MPHQMVLSHFFIWPVHVLGWCLEVFFATDGVPSRARLLHATRWVRATQEAVDLFIGVREP